VSFAVASEFIGKHHRHHVPPRGAKFVVGCESHTYVDIMPAVKVWKLCGVAVAGRPVSRVLDDGKTLEVTRLCTDGTPNACSYLYSACARIAGEMGYYKIQTYILASESGVSLRAAGWQKEADIRGKSWSTPSRPRVDAAPTVNKERWAKIVGRRPAGGK
jgi:hypothetical protein